MTMTPEEICRHYQQAANKGKDIGVLADLNATDKASIRAVLIDGGLLAADKPKRASRSKNYETRADLADAVGAGIADGLTNKEIAEKCGCCESTVKNHRRRREQAETKAAGPAPAQEAARPGPSPDPSIYSRLEAILAAIPPEASEDVRGNACELCSSLLWEYMSRRLGVKEG